MIVSFRDKRTKELAEGNRVKAFSGFERKAELKLDQLEAATSLLDLSLPGKSRIPNPFLSRHHHNHSYPLS